MKEDRIPFIIKGTDQDGDIVEILSTRVWQPPEFLGQKDVTQFQFDWGGYPSTRQDRVFLISDHEIAFRLYILTLDYPRVSKVTYVDGIYNLATNKIYLKI
jgi:hypothetical protein